MDAQIKRITAQALLKDMTLGEVITDEDEFSGDLNRPGAQRMLAMVRQGQVSAVIITKLDRLTRSTRDAIDLVELFNRKGVTLISIAESLDTVSPMGQFFVTMIAAIAQLERQMIGSRTSDGLQNLKAQGFPAGAAPYGWTSQPRTAEEKLKKIRKVLLKNPEEQAIMALMQGLRSKGESMESIAKTLNGNGYRTRKGGEWKHQYVANVLKGLD